MNEFSARLALKIKNFHAREMQKKVLTV